jgi:hypothetical protein
LEGFYGHGNRAEIVPPTNPQVVVWDRLHLGWTLERELHLGLLGMLLDCAEQERDRAIAKGFLGSSNSSSVQQVELPYARSHSFFDHEMSSSSSTTTWRRGRSTRRSLLLRVCVHTQFHFIKKNNFFCCTPHFYPKCTGWKWRRYSEITEMVSFLVLLLSVCLSNAFFSWFVCGKMLTSYLWKEIERFDAFYAGRGTSSRLLCDQTTWFERKFCCSPCRSEKLWR